MKSISLREVIRERVGKQLDQIVIRSRSKDLLYSDLVNISGKLHNKKVIIFVEDPVSLIITLVALDGSVKEFCPISTIIDKEELKHLLSLGEFDTVVSDIKGSELKIFRDQNINYINLAELDLYDEDQHSNNKQITTWLIPTSGTTSKPKLVRHELDSIASSALKKPKKYPSHNEVWGQFYDFTRYAGYQVFLNSLLNGHTLVTSSSDEGIYERVKLYSEKHVTHISATPTQWRKILMSGSSTNIPLKQIILGGEAADQPILKALRKKFPMAKITHTYASTEAGLGISVSDGLVGFPLRFLENSEDRVDIQIHDKRLYLRSSSTALGYNDDTELKNSDGWIDTGDLVKIEGERFFIIGRSNGVINIGGDKVNPDFVRQTLLEQPKVAEVRVYGRKNPITGMLLVVDVQLKSQTNPEDGKKEVMAFIKGNLQLKDQPRIINIVDEIFTNSTGKISQRS